MAYSFLDTCNRVLRRFNEVELDAGTFASTVGFHAQVKDAIYAVLYSIEGEGVDWPWNNIQRTLTVTPLVTRYACDSDLRNVNVQSFRLNENTALDAPPRKLEYVPYDIYLRYYAQQEDTPSLDESRAPQKVTLADDLDIIIVPSPDKAYTIRYEAFRNATYPVVASDTINIPDSFYSVILDGATMHCHQFRENDNGAAFYEKQFTTGMKHMRKNYINKPDRVVSSVSTG